MRFAGTWYRRRWSRDATVESRVHESMATFIVWWMSGSSFFIWKSYVKQLRIETSQELWQCVIKNLTALYSYFLLHLSTCSILFAHFFSMPILPIFLFHRYVRGSEIVHSLEFTVIFLKSVGSGVERLVESSEVLNWIPYYVRQVQRSE